MSAAARENPKYIEARRLVLGAVETLERITRPDGIPFGEYVPRQAARALRSAADMLDPPAARFDGLLVRENGFVPEGEVWVRPARALEPLAALARYGDAAARIRAGEPYPACCYPETAAGRLLEREADEVRTERSHAEGI